MTLKQAWKYIGGLSEPSKMPCYAYNTPAQKCITGAKLAEVENSVCSKCYALRGNYRFSNVKKALMRRWRSLRKSQWVEAMVTAITLAESSGFFRWHDSGDLQGDWHLSNIAEVAKRLPHVKFWLPTREYGIVTKWLAAHGSFPDNLTVRLSGYMMEGEPPTSLAQRLNLTTSGVSKVGYTCPASSQGNKCLTCRACWDKQTPNINYKQH